MKYNNVFFSLLRSLVNAEDNPLASSDEPPLGESNSIPSVDGEVDIHLETMSESTVQQDTIVESPIPSQGDGTLGAVILAGRSNTPLRRQVRREPKRSCQNKLRSIKKKKPKRKDTFPWQSIENLQQRERYLLQRYHDADDPSPMIEN